MANNPMKVKPSVGKYDEIDYFCSDAVSVDEDGLISWGKSWCFECGGRGWKPIKVHDAWGLRHCGCAFPENVEDADRLQERLYFVASFNHDKIKEIYDKTFM